jgi:hypothetical protein
MPRFGLISDASQKDLMRADGCHASRGLDQLDEVTLGLG